jgi:hypothetical protein
MTHTTHDHIDAGGHVTTSIDQTSGKADQAKEQASQVGGAAAQQAGAVAGTAKEQAGQVVSDARTHAQDLMGQTTAQVGAQADEQTQRLSGNLRTLSEQFGTMASSGEPGSTARTLVDEASRRAADLSSYLDGRQFGQIVNDVKGFARRRPGTFILGSAVAGLMVGRLGRAVKDAPDSTDVAAPGTPAAGQPATPAAYPVGSETVTREFTTESDAVAPTAAPLGGEWA